MKTSKTVLALAVALAGFTAADSAFAQHRHRHHHHHHGSRLALGIGLGLALPFAAYPYYSPRYAYYPPYYPAPVYVEQDQQPAPAAQPSAPAYWYYCADSRAYYPHVKECASGWQRVAPQPR